MIQMNHVSFQYESGTRDDGLRDVNLHIKRGEVVLLCGESGCGKTTLTRLINGLIPHYFEGELSGHIRLNGKDLSRMPLHETAMLVGSVFQNPRSQFFNVDTDSELAFGCENQGLPVEEIVQRVQKTVEHLNIRSLVNRSIFKLSGGEKQKIACGCVHAASPDIIVLDEPSSKLDAQATADLAQIIAHWKREGKTIVIAEHRLFYLSRLADRILFMHSGRIEKEFRMEDAKKLTESRWLEYGLRPLSFNHLTAENGPAVWKEQIEFAGFNFTYKNGHVALRAGSFGVPKGGAVAIVGQNGAGKSTLARCLCGLNKKFKGIVKIGSRTYGKKELTKSTYMVMQDVNHQLFCESVMDEVLLSMKEEDTSRAEAILKGLNLLERKDLHPMSLSGGQKQRVAVAAAVASQREIIVFDEPTSGLDLRHMKQVSSLIGGLKEAGKTVFIISHDLEFIMKTCDYLLHIENGSVVKSGFLDKDYLFSFFNCKSKKNTKLYNHFVTQREEGNKIIDCSELNS